jgi:hypothetical protein
MTTVQASLFDDAPPTLPQPPPDPRIDVDITRNYHGGDPYSAAAHESIKTRKRRDQEAIFQFVRAAGGRGATCEEVEEGLGLSHQTASARVSELRRDGRLAEIGRRSTRSGRPARVHQAVEQQ